MGLPSGLVWIADYTEEWSRLFEEERGRLLAAVGPIIIALQHVGSTAISGLCAKPIIDIAVGVTDLETGKKCIGPFAQMGYEYKGDAGIPGRHFFAKGKPENRTHYVHVEPLNGKLWRNHILFRDYLRSHPDVLSAYAQLKRSLAEKHSKARETYALGKKLFIDAIIVKASEVYELDENGLSRPRRQRAS